MHTARMVLVLALSALASAAQAQLPPGLPISPDRYAVTHPFGAPGKIHARNEAMGGAYVADSRWAGHGNPAGLMSLRRPTGWVTYGVHPYEAIPDITNWSVAYALPLDENNVVKVTWFSVKASGAITGTPIHVDANEGDPSIEFARRVSSKLVLAAGFAYLDTTSTYDIAGLGTVTRIKSRPDAPGGRLGATYDLSRQWTLGATYDLYTERITRDVPVLHSPSQVFTFHTNAYRLGVAFRPDARTTLLADYQDMSVRGNNTRIISRPLMLGVERTVGTAAMRLGSSDGKICGGVGLRYKQWDLSYTLTRRGDRDLPGMGSDTAHLFEVTASY